LLEVRPRYGYLWTLHAVDIPATQFTTAAACRQEKLMSHHLQSVSDVITKMSQSNEELEALSLQ